MGASVPYTDNFQGRIGGLRPVRPHFLQQVAVVNTYRPIVFQKFIISGAGVLIHHSQRSLVDTIEYIIYFLWKNKHQH